MLPWQTQKRASKWKQVLLMPRLGTDPPSLPPHSIKQKLQGQPVSRGDKIDTASLVKGIPRSYGKGYGYRKRWRIKTINAIFQILLLVIWLSKSSIFSPPFSAQSFCASKHPNKYKQQSFFIWIIRYCFSFPFLYMQTSKNELWKVWFWSWISWKTLKLG